MRIGKRNYSFFNSFPSPTSERVKIILSSQKDADALVDAIERSRKNGNQPTQFTVQEKTARILEAVEAKMAS